MRFKATNIPLEVDVWNELEDELKTGLNHILILRFHYSVEQRHGYVDIEYFEEGQLKNHWINLDNEKAEKLVIRLCERFNIEWRNIGSLRFKLKPGEVPVFDIEVYPFVDCATTLDTTKSRMKPITID